MSVYGTYQGGRQLLRRPVVAPSSPKPGAKLAENIGKTTETTPASKFSKEELAIKEYLENRFGMKVEKNPLEGVQGFGRQGDAFVNGVKTEFKTIMKLNPDSNTIRHIVDESISGTGQARVIIIDARGSGLSAEEALRGIRRAMGIGRGKLDGVWIIGDNFFL